jgi:quercetin dioxygenase-like cupin family protein
VTRKGGPTPSGRDSCLWYLDQTVTIYAEAEQTGGIYGLLVGEVPKHSGPPPHVHSHEDEAFLVTTGHLHAWCGDQFFDLPKGSFGFLPRGLVHWFQAIADEPTTIVTVVSPGGHEEMFRAIAGGAATDPDALPPPLKEWPVEKVIREAARVGVNVTPLHADWVAFKQAQGADLAAGRAPELFKSFHERHGGSD